MKNKNLYLVILNIFLFLIIPQSWAQIETPEKHFGFKPGADRMLFNYDDLIDYMKILDDSSPRLRLVEIGKSTMGKNIYIAFISSEENINNLENLKEINKKLALDPNLDESARESYFEKGKIFVLGTLSMHASEVAPAQASPIIAYDLVTSDDPQVLNWLNDVVYMMVPSHNPDGMDLIVNHYKKYKGTKYERSSFPGVYNKYSGHDNNRDFVALTQKESKIISAIYNKDWFPQVMVEKHQMGSTGTRYFVPPMHDPIAENVDAGIWNWTWIFGSNMITDMTKAGLKGVSQHNSFDDYWPGSTETCIWKNVIGMLTEAASADLATPIFVESNELRVWGKGLGEYKKSINMPEPWEGGWWRLGDIVQYEIVSTMSILKTSSLHRKAILQSRNDLCRKEVEKGESTPPYYYVLPLEQHDQSEFVALVNLLREHGVKVFSLQSDVTVDNLIYKKGAIVVPLAQPFRAFIKEVMEKQNYPARHYTPEGELIKPYDITSWSLPLHKGVKAIEMNKRCETLESSIVEIDKNYKLMTAAPKDFSAIVLNIKNNQSYKIAFQALKLGLDVEQIYNKTKINEIDIPVGSFVIKNNSLEKMQILLKDCEVSPVFVTNKLKIDGKPVKIPRIALVETYFHDMDAGWTRFIFDSYYIPYNIVHPGDFKNTNFAKKYDVVIFPDVQKSILMEGKYKSKDNYYVSSYPPEFTKGIDKEGMEKLMEFLDNGGKIVSWGKSTELFENALQIKHGKEDIEEFQLPFSDISEELEKSGLYCPGSLVKIQLLEDHPLTLGMQKEIGVFFRGKPVFGTSIPDFDMDRRVIGKFPEKDILMSGYCDKEDQLSNKSVMLWLKKGKGQIVLFGFNPQFRASTNVSYKLLFNSLLL